MILFYNKDNGEIFATIDGRIHDRRQMAVSVDNGIENVGKFIIGWEETDELEDYEEVVEKLVEVENGLFKKVKVKEKRQRFKKIEHNLDKFELLQRFEDETPENPMDYKVENNNLIKK